MVLCLRFAGVAAVPVRVPMYSVGEEMSANAAVFLVLARVSTHSVGEEILPTPAVKKPSVVGRPWSHVPLFGGHCCPGVSRPVPADDDLSSPRSGSILPSSLSNLTHTLGEGSGVCVQGLQCCTVSTGVTVTCACAVSRLRFSTSRFSAANSSSPTLPSSISLMRLLTFCLGIEIACFNFCNSDRRLTLNSWGVGGSKRAWNQLSSPSTTRSKPFILLQVASFSNARRSLIFRRRWASTVSVTIACIRLSFLSCSDSKSTAKNSSCVYPFFIISMRNVILLTFASGILSPFLASLPFLYSASSAPVLMSLSPGRSCARSRHSSYPSSGDTSLLGGILKFFRLILHTI